MKGGAIACRIDAGNGQASGGKLGPGRGRRDANPVERSSDVETGEPQTPVTFGLGGQFQNSLDVVEFDPAEVAFHPGNGGANQTPAHGGRELG